MVTTSPARTVIVPQSPTAIYGTIPAPPALRWPVADPNAVLDYYLDATVPLAEVLDTVLFATAAVKPSGLGEMVATNLVVTGSILSLWLAGGLAGRRYTIEITATTIYNREFGWTIGLLVNPSLGAFPLPPPASTGFGTLLTWGTVGIVPYGLLGLGGVPLLGADNSPLQYAH